MQKWVGGEKKSGWDYCNRRFKELQESDVFVLCPIVWSVIAFF